MSEVRKSRASQFLGADVMGVRRYLEEGEHILQVRRTIQEPSKNTDKLKKNPTLENTIIEFKVIATKLLDGTQMVLDENGQPTKKAQGSKVAFEPLRVNESCSLCETSDQAGYKGNVLTVTCGLLGMTIDEMNKDPNADGFFEGAYGPEQILTGFLVSCVVQQVPTKAGGVYSAKTWEALPWDKYADYGIEAPHGAYDPRGTRSADPVEESAAAAG